MLHAKTRQREPLLYFGFCISTPRAFNQESRCILGSLLPLHLAVRTFGARLPHSEEATENWYQKPPKPPTPQDDRRPRTG